MGAAKGRRVRRPAGRPAAAASSGAAAREDRGTAGRRLDWHAYFMNIARQVATRSTCDRRHVGAVVVRDRNILSTGYNGSIRGMPHCDEAGHEIEGGHCVATIHAEANAILQAAKNGVMIDGAELYTTASPCWSCFKLIANSGIRRIYFGEFYRDAKSIRVARRLGIELMDLGPAGEGAPRPGEAPGLGRRGPDD
ncbi:MAG: cytidine/deoxycytidylate deaminase family protein [Acidobacteriota bacterium]